MEKLSKVTTAKYIGYYHAKREALGECRPMRPGMRKLPPKWRPIKRWRKKRYLKEQDEKLSQSERLWEEIERLAEEAGITPSLIWF